MNTLIETLNRFGENTLHFAWPMLWQSSVLIAMLFAIDFALRRYVRAAVRYALWLVLLVKLLLPPSLALPTSATWWLFPSTAASKPRTTRFVVRYGPDIASRFPSQPAPVFTPPQPPISAATWIVPVWGALSLGLLVWMTARWRQVARDVKRAAPAPAWLDELFNAAKSSIGLRRNVRLRVTDQAMSPAICGLFRPVILLPQSLVEKLPPAQLRAVLLHELTHLRRGDVWANCAQALLQTVYWWHPLVWLANARIRRVREEAVDDAVMLTLRDEAETYAPTLLEVAKLAFNRPLASLGLVGILESRSALRQRIERLVNFRAPRKAGLTLVSLCGICVFSAAALPMGEAPAPSSDTSNFDRKENVPDKVVEADRLVRDAKLLYEMSKFDEAEKRLTSALALAPENQAAHYYMNLVQTAKANRQWLSGIARTSPGRKDIVDKLNRIRFDKVSWPDGLPLSEALRNLSDQTRLCDPDKKGINFTFHPNAPAASAATASADGATTINPTTGLPEATPADVAVDASSINVKLKLTNMRLGDLLDAIVLVADHPIKYSILDDGIVFSTRDSNSAPLETRTFKLNTNVFLANLQKQTGLQTNVSAAMRQLLSNVGLDLSPPKTIFFSDGKSMLFVRATEQDLDTVEKVLVVLNNTPPQIHIKARFIEVPEETLKGLGANFIATGVTNVAGMAGILTGPNLRLVLHGLEQGEGCESLAEPEVTTTSGRRTQMRATEIITVITNFVFQEISTNGAITPQTEKVEVGPVLDTVASVLPDGYTIDLRAIPSLTEFLGYDKTTNTTPTITSTGKIVEVPTIRPSFCVRQAETHLQLWDGQTVVLGGLISTQIQTIKDTEPVSDSRSAATPQFRTQTTRTLKKQQLLFLITVTLVDAAGNRIHSDDEMLIARPGIPPQDSR
jgi:beta-lactamase regulating signal transducer with metallopeptidase domain